MAKNIDDWFVWVEANRDTPTRKWAEEVLPQAKQALYSDILELVGEDDGIVNNTKDYKRVFLSEAEAYGNEERQELRRKLKEYFNL